MDWSADRVLEFGPRTQRKGMRWLQRRELLWPVWAWQFVVPHFGGRRLDLLQRAVLRLSRAGVREYVEAARLLGLDAGLVAFIGDGLAKTGYVERTTGLPTPKGLEALVDEVADLGEVRVAWVFRCALSGRLLPFVPEDLSYADVEPDQAARPWVRSGSKGSPRRDRAFVVPAGCAAGPTPSATEVAAAAQRHERRARRFRRAGFELGDVPAAKVDSISAVDEDPQAFWLHTFVYVPEELDEEPEPWYVADPFGYGGAPRMREHLDRLRRSGSPGLREHLDALTGESDIERRTRWLQLQGEIEDRAEEHLGDLWGLGEGLAPPEVWRSLRSAFVALVRFDSLVEAPAAASERLSEVYLPLRQALENVVQRLWRCPRAPQATETLYDGGRLLGREACELRLDGRARNLGFVGPLPREILSCVPHGALRFFERDETANLRPACAALVLAAHDVPNHPLAGLARRNPRWLHLLNEVASAAGAEIHQSRAGQGLQDARRHAELVVSLCRDALEVMEPAAREQRVPPPSPRSIVPTGVVHVEEEEEVSQRQQRPEGREPGERQAE